MLLPLTEIQTGKVEFACQIARFVMDTPIGRDHRARERGPAPVAAARAAIGRAGAFSPPRARRCCCANLLDRLTRRCGRWSPEATFRWCWQRPNRWRPPIDR